MARGDAPKLKDKNKGRNPNVALREEGPAKPSKPSKTSSKHSALHSIRHPSTGMKRLFRPDIQRKEKQSPKLKYGASSDSTSNRDPSNEDLRHLASEPAPTPLLLGYQSNSVHAPGSKTNDSDISSLHDEQSEVPRTKKALGNSAPSRRSKLTRGKGNAPGGLFSKPKINPGMVLPDHNMSAPDMSDAGSAPTQILIMSRSSETVPDAFQEPLFEVQADIGHFSESDHKRFRDISDLIEMCRSAETLEYTSPRDMSSFLDEMAGRSTENDRHPRQRSLTPFLGSPSSYIEVLAEATSSVKGRAGLSRIYVSAWILRSVTESRLDGLRFNIVIHLTIFVLSEVERNTLVSKPGRLAKLAKEAWYSDLATHSIQSKMSRAPKSSNRTRKSIFEAATSPTSSLLTAWSSRPNQNRITQNFESKAVSQITPTAKTRALSENRENSSGRMGIQRYNVYRDAQTYLGGTSELLADRLVGVWRWLDPLQSINNLQSLLRKEVRAEKDRSTANSKEDNSSAGPDTESLTEWVELSSPEQHHLEDGMEISRTVSTQAQSGNQPQQNILVTLCNNIFNFATKFVKR